MKASISPWYRFCQTVLQVLFAALWRVRIRGVHHVPLTGPVLLVANHQSFLDPPLCGVALPRELNYLARDSLFHNPLFAALIRSLNALPIRRNAADVKAIRTVVDCLQQDRALVLFPEATRTADGRIRPLQGGVDLIARRARATVVPVVIDGAFECWPRTQLLPTWGPIWVSYGPPIGPGELRRLSREDFTDLLNRRLREMQTQLRQQRGRRPLDYSAPVSAYAGTRNQR